MAFNYQIIPVCDICEALFDLAPQPFKIGDAIKLQIPEHWRLISIDGDKKCAKRLICPDHQEISVNEVLANEPELPTPPTTEPTKPQLKVH